MSKFLKFYFHPTTPLEPLTPYERPIDTTAWNPGIEDVRRRAMDARQRRDPQLSARLFVGLNVGGKPTWTMDDIKAEAFFLREDMKADPSFTIYMGEGVYRGEKDIISEKSAQIVIVHFKPGWEEFASEMVDYAHRLADLLLQESVLLKLADRNVTDFSELIFSDLTKEERSSESPRVQQIREHTAKFLKMF